LKEDSIRDLLAQVADGRMSADEALGAMRRLPFEDLGFAKIDHHRTMRCGAPEVIFCAGKTAEHVARIAQSLLEAGSDLLASRATPEHFEAVQAICADAEYHAAARCITVRQSEPEEAGCVVVVTGGTSDLPVAEEAAVTSRMLGARTELISDVGVAGIHRLLAFREQLENANVIVAVAGMEGALASVVGGLVAKPVIAVPTSIGYGTHFGGVTPLLAMLNSCASGVAVVNIDNGFGAGYIAALINSLAVGTPDKE
jgi:hypothetical protein